MRRLFLRLLRIPTVRAVRGATTVPRDDAASMHDAVVELVQAISHANSLDNDEVISALFTVTPDLVAAFPAQAARVGGWESVPLLCATEIAVPGSLERCIRILLHVTRSWSDPPRHVYLRNATVLRPDLSGDRSRRGALERRAAG